MPRYYCDYCDKFLQHDFVAGRKQHNNGRPHLENVKHYYQTLLDQQNRQQFAPNPMMPPIGGQFPPGPPPVMPPSGPPMLYRPEGMPAPPTFGMPTPQPHSSAPPVPMMQSTPKMQVNPARMAMIGQER